MKRLFYIIAILMFFSFNVELVNADNIHFVGEYYYLEKDGNIEIYNNNIYFDVINDSKYLYSNDEILIFNYNDSIGIYDLNTKKKETRIFQAYNALIYDNYIIYESDYNNDFICKNMVGSVYNRNCYKIYAYDIFTGSNQLLELEGNDNYLNDLYGNKLVYTSIHYNDKLCDNLCSFVNVYDLNFDENIVINSYEELSLDMSGNGHIHDNIVYFESAPNLYDCDNVQIFSYNILTNMIDIITYNNHCFDEDSEIISVSEGYLLFKSNYNNYENNNKINYIYSYVDDKYTIVDKNLLFEKSLNLCGIDICNYDGKQIKLYKIDSIAPEIDSSIKYTVLFESDETLFSKLEYKDNLTNNDGMLIELLDEMDRLGEYFIGIKLCDRFKNCISEQILVEVIDVDISAPKIYCYDTITIKNNEVIDITKYGYAIDNVDGRINLSIVGSGSYQNVGIYTLLVESKDSSGNISYKEIEVIVYDNLNLYRIYFLILIISLVMVVIIYILRFKKRNNI